MQFRHALIAFALPALSSLQGPAWSQEQGAVLDSRDASQDEQEPMVELERDIKIRDEIVAYRVRAGALTLREESGEPKARIFHTSYVRREAGVPEERPITFLFNGGPGSSSVWLHLGAFGPRRVAMDPEGFPLAPPTELVDNPHSLLDVSDLVFIDPVSTGFSRAEEGQAHERFHGYTQDIEVVGEFIERWTSENGRWASPKFLCGESYGTTRAAGLAEHLQERYGMYLNGVVLVSAVLDFSTLRFDAGNDLPYVLFLPAFTATAHYHGRLEPRLAADFDQTLREVERFAETEYASALLRGSALDPDRKQAVARELARYTGLSEAFVLAHDLRVTEGAFTKELLRSERRTVGRLDSRFQGRDRTAGGEGREYDPSYAAIQGPYSAGINDYLRRELGYPSELPYEVLTGRVRPWDYSNAENEYLNVSDSLRSAMASNEHLTVFLAGGYFDLATPYFAAEYTLNHLSMEPHYRERFTTSWYPAGHMMYIQESSLVRLMDEVRGYYLGTLAR